VWNEDTPKTYNSGSDGDVLVSQGQGRPPKWTPLESGTTYIQGEGIHINNNEINVESLYFDNWNTAYSWGDHSAAGYLNNVSISVPVSNQFLTYDGTNWINVNPDTDDIVEGPGNLYYTDERVDTRISLASLGDLSNVKATSPIVGEILSYNGTNWVRDGTIKSLTDMLDGTSYDYINVTAPQHVKASWSYSTSLSITAPHASMLLDGGLFISSKAPITDSSGNKQVLGAIEAQFGGAATDLEVDFMVEGTSMLIGDTFIGPNGNLVLFGDILSNSGQTILGSGGIVFDSNLSVWNEDTPKTYNSGSDGDVLVSQGHGKPPKWIQHARFDTELNVWNEDTPETYNSGFDGDVLVSQGQGRPPKWTQLASAAGGVPAPVVSAAVTTGITLPGDNLLDHDFRNYSESGGNVIDADGNVIAAIIGGGTSFTSSEGLVTSTSNYIEITNPLPALGSTGNFSIEFYARMNDPASAWHAYFSARNATTDTYVQLILKQDDAWLIELWHNSVLRQATYRPFPVGAWDSTNFHHFIFTFGGTTTEKLYMDGVEVTKLSNTYNNSITFDPYESFEKLQISGSQSYDTNIETTKYFRLYNGVLTTDEIATLYENRDGTFGATETVVTDTTNYVLASNNTDGTETKWLSVVPAPLSTSSGPALLDGNIESIDFTNATISGTNVEIDGNIIGTTVGTGVAVSETGGISTTEASYVDLNMSTGFAWTSNFTLEFYFKMPSGSVDSQQYNGLFASFNGTAGSAFGDYLVVERRDTGDGIHFYTTPANRNDGYNTLYTDSTVSGFDGTWGHLVLTNDSSQPTHLQKQMYVNGVLFTTGVLNVGSQVNFAAGSRDHYWVGRNGFGTFYENGVENLKIFRVYNRILTAQEAATLYENRDGASGSSDVTNYHLVSNNATGTVTKWEPMNSGSSRPYANLINTNGVHINLISGYTDLPFTSAILSSGIYLDSGGYLFTVNNSGVYICNVSFRLGDPDAWTSMHIRDSNNIIIATSHAIGTTNSIEAGFFFMAELNQGTSYKFTVYRNGAGATLLANAGDGYQINCLINHV
jgi:hypothetical protein